MICDVFIPVRLLSSRLSKKALLEISGKPIIQILIERLSKAKKIRNIVVCTTTSSSDDELVNFLVRNGFKFFRGSDKDILKRYLDVAITFNTDYIINVDGDDIYTDPKTIDDIVTKYNQTKNDFIKISGVPLGLQSFGFPLSTLKKICETKSTNDTETGWIRFFTETQLFSQGEVHQNLITKFPNNIRLSLDYTEDFQIAKEIFSHLGTDFNLEELSRFLQDNPTLIDLIKQTDEKWKSHWNTDLSDISLKSKEDKI